MDNVTLNIILALLISFFILALGYLGIMLIVIPYWDKKDKKENEEENEKKNNKNCCPTASNSALKEFPNSGSLVSSLEQDGIYYKPYFDKEKGLYVPMIFVGKRNLIYYQLIPLNVLSDIHNHFAEEINESLMKNNKENNEQGDNNG